MEYKIPVYTKQSNLVQKAQMTVLSYKPAESKCNIEMK